MAHAIGKITSLTRNPIFDSERVWEVLEYNIVEAREIAGSGFNSMNCANILWACAKTNRKPDKVLKVMEAQVLVHIDTFNSQDIANTVWAYARVGHSSPRLFDAIAHKAMDRLDDFNSQAIANTLWAYATMGHSSPKLFDSILIKAMENLDTFNSQAVANTVWAYASIGYKIDSIKLDAFVSKAASVLDEFKVQGIINLLWSLAVFDFKDVDAVDPLFSKITNDYNSLAYDEDDYRKLSKEELSQLHQVSLWYNKECKKDSLLPAKLRKESKLAFIANESSPSNLQKDVLRIFESLDSLGLVVVDEEANCNQTGYSLDFVIGTKNNQKDLAVEIDGPSHFMNCSPTGATILKRRQLSNLANRPLLSIPYWEWEELSFNGYKPSIERTEMDDKNEEKKKRKQFYIKECLQKVSFL